MPVRVAYDERKFPTDANPPAEPARRSGAGPVHGRGRGAYLGWTGDHQSRAGAVVPIRRRRGRTRRGHARRRSSPQLVDAPATDDRPAMDGRARCDRVDAGAAARRRAAGDSRRRSGHARRCGRSPLELALPEQAMAGGALFPRDWHLRRLSSRIPMVSRPGGGTPLRTARQPGVFPDRGWPGSAASRPSSRSRGTSAARRGISIGITAGSNRTRRRTSARCRPSRKAICRTSGPRPRSTARDRSCSSIRS